MYILLWGASPLVRIASIQTLCRQSLQIVKRFLHAEDRAGLPPRLSSLGMEHRTRVLRLVRNMRSVADGSSGTGVAPILLIDFVGMGGLSMLWTIAVVLAVLWLLGIVTSYTMGGFIHLLLALAIITILIRVIQGRRPI